MTLIELATYVQAVKEHNEAADAYIAGLEQRNANLEAQVARLAGDSFQRDNVLEARIRVLEGENARLERDFADECRAHAQAVIERDFRLRQVNAVRSALETA